MTRQQVATRRALSLSLPNPTLAATPGESVRAQVWPSRSVGFAGLVRRRYGGSNELCGKYLFYEQFYLLMANC